MADVALALTADEKARYSPLHMWTEFTEGFDDCVLGYGSQRRMGYSGLRQQAYDFGTELATKRGRNRS